MGYRLSDKCKIHKTALASFINPQQIFFEDLQFYYFQNMDV